MTTCSVHVVADFWNLITIDDNHRWCDSDEITCMNSSSFSTVSVPLILHLLHLSNWVMIFVGFRISDSCFMNISITVILLLSDRFFYQLKFDKKLPQIRYFSQKGTLYRCRPLVIECWTQTEVYQRIIMQFKNSKSDLKVTVV